MSQTNRGMTRKEFEQLSAVDMLRLVGDELAKVKNPSVVFGDEANAKSNYRHMSGSLHPDKYAVTPTLDDDDLAGTAFGRLSELWNVADKQIKAGNYGVGTEATSAIEETSEIIVQHQTYQVLGILRNSSVGIYYHATNQHGSHYIFHVARTADHNSIIDNEAAVLKNIMSGKLADGQVDGERWERLQANHYIPTYVSSFDYEGRRANILTYPDYLPDPSNWRTLAEVVDHFNSKLNPRHIGWIWNKLIPSLSVAHDMGYVHGNITPDSIWISVDQEVHEVLLFDWGHTSSGQTPMTSGSSRWIDYYHPEVMQKIPPLPAHDVYMAAKSMTFACPQMKTEPDLGRMDVYYRNLILPFSSGILSDLNALHSNWRLVIHEQMGWDREFIRLDFNGEAVLIEWEWLWKT